LVRDGTCLHRGSGGGDGGRSDQDGQRLAHRPRREIQPVAAHRRRAGGCGLLPRPASVRPVTRTRLIGIAAGIVLAGLAFQAGEYSTLDWLTLRRQRAEERRSERDLEVELDSPQRLARGLETG